MCKTPFTIRFCLISANFFSSFFHVITYITGNTGLVSYSTNITILYLQNNTYIRYNMGVWSKHKQTTQTNSSGILNKPILQNY